MPTVQKLQIVDQELKYTLKRSWRTRSVRLTIHPEQGLMVSAHHWYPQYKIEQFIQEKSDWVMTHLGNQRQISGFSFGNGAMITLLGDDLEIEVVASKEIRPGVQIINKESLEVDYKHRDMSIMDPGLRRDDGTRLVIAVPLGNVRNAEKFFEKWLPRFIQQTIQERVSHYVQQFNLKVGRIMIKNQRSLWGSCSTKQNLNFSRRLIQAPVWLIDYVVCHELAHLMHMNHSERFWAKVCEYYPEYRKARRHLRAFKPTVRLP